MLRALGGVWIKQRAKECFEKGGGYDLECDSPLDISIAIGSLN
jgi:hypothetical protein